MQDTIRYMGKDIQRWLQKCKLKFAAFRPSKLKLVMNISEQTGHCEAMGYNRCFSTIQHHHPPVYNIYFHVSGVSSLKQLWHVI